jgi:hypothetical protein
MISLQLGGLFSTVLPNHQSDTPTQYTTYSAHSTWRYAALALERTQIERAVLLRKYLERRLTQSKVADILLGHSSQQPDLYLTDLTRLIAARNRYSFGTAAIAASTECIMRLCG